MDPRREPASPHGHSTAQDRSEQAEELRVLSRLLGGGAAPERGPRREESPASAWDPSVSGAATPARFVPEHALGSVPFGEAFLARDLEQSQRAVRVVRLFPELSDRPGLSERIEALGRQLASLGATPRPWTVARGSGGRLEVASEPFEGEGLRSLLTRRGTLPPAHALEIARQALAALETLHARGLVHGALQATSVWLEGRVSWSARNPFGVGVRLLDSGLASCLAPEACSQEHDLEAVGALLVEMLSGTRLEPGSEDARAAPRSLARTLRAGGLARLLERALGQGPPFGDARAFRVALERSRAWRGESVRLRWSAGVAVLLALGLGALWRHERNVRAAEHGEAESERQTANARATLPAATSALDRFLLGIEEGRPEVCQQVLAAARGTPSLASLGFDTGYLERTLAVRASLDAAARSTEPLERARRLLEARASMELAREERERFFLAGAGWLASGLPPRPSRAADCQRWHASLERALAQDSAALTATLESRWNTLAGDEADDPEEVRLLARWFADERVADYARHLPAQATLLRDELLGLASGLVFGERR